MAVWFDGGKDDRLAPVIPLFGEGGPAPGDDDGEGEETAETAIVTSLTSDVPRPHLEPVDWAAQVHSEGAGEAPCATAEFDAAWERLVKRLRSKPLSEREAKRFLADDVQAETIDAVIAEGRRLGYLDDARLAEQLVHRARSRKAQGRSAIAQELSARGIAREAIDAALDEAPDDEEERAFEFARSRARSLASLDPDVALRRLTAQLARRGFGNLALRVARDVLSDERESGH